MARVPCWGGDTPDSAAWDVVGLGGKRLPGIATVSVSNRGRNIDAQASKGTDGVELKDNGLTPAKITIKLKLFEHHWSDWLAVLPTIDPQRPGAMRQPLKIEHPEPNSVAIDTVYVTSIDGEPPDVVTGKIVTIECIQWFPRPKATKTSKTPKGKTATLKSIDENGLPVFETNTF